MLLSASIARTRNAYSPNAKSVYSSGEEQGRKIASPSGAMNAHSKVTPGVSEENSNVAVVLSVGVSGPMSMNVSGVGVTVQV